MLKTDHKKDDLILSDDINDIAFETNRLTAREGALTAELADVQETLSTVGESEKKFFDLRTMTPSFIVRLNAAVNNVGQNGVKDPLTGEWYFSQGTSIDSTVAGAESTWITRCSPAGAMIDVMKLDAAGHGANMEIQRVGSNVYVWCVFASVSSTGATTQQSIARVKYSAGFKTKGHADVTIIPTFQGITTYHNASFDFDNDWCVLRVSYNGTSPNNAERYERRKISEMLANVDKVYGTIDPVYTNLAHPSGTGKTSQGYCFFGNTLFRLSGQATRLADPHRITAMKIPDTGVVSEVNATLYSIDVTSIGMESNGQYLGDFVEPEGIAMYKAPDGRYSLLLNKTVGPAGTGKNYSYKVYAFTQGDNADALHAPTLDFLTSIALTKADYTARGPGSAKSFRELDQPGWYYLTAEQVATMGTDRPTSTPGQNDAISGGYFVWNSPRTVPGGQYNQMLYSLVAVTNASGPRRFWRSLDGLGGASVWSQDTRAVAPYWTTA